MCGVIHSISLYKEISLNLGSRVSNSWWLMHKFKVYTRSQDSPNNCTKLLPLPPDDATKLNFQSLAKRKIGYLSEGSTHMQSDHIMNMNITNKNFTCELSWDHLKSPVLIQCIPLPENIHFPLCKARLECLWAFWKSSHPGRAKLASIIFNELKNAFSFSSFCFCVSVCLEGNFKVLPSNIKLQPGHLLPRRLHATSKRYAPINRVIE